jgi:hypothetical protein
MHRIHRAIIVFMLFSCATVPPYASQAGDGAEQPPLLAAPVAAEVATAGLIHRLDALPDGAGISFRYTITNPDDAGSAAAITFSSGEIFDIRVLAGEEVLWNRSANLRFTQALKTITIEAGASQGYTALWNGTCPSEVEPDWEHITLELLVKGTDVRFTLRLPDVALTPPPDAGS